MFCGHHIVALHSFFFIKSTPVVRWCVHVSIIRTHLACKMLCERPVFQIAENPKEISWVGQHISRLSRMLLAGCSVDFTCGVAKVFLGEVNTSSALMSQRLKKVQNVNIFCSHTFSNATNIKHVCSYSCLFISYCYLFMFIISGSSFLVGEVIRIVVEDKVKRLFAFVQPVSNLMIN